MTSLTYPSKNVFVQKGKVTTRAGITLLGQSGDKDRKKAVNSAITWYASTSGEQPLRMYKNVLQLFKGGTWFDLYNVGVDAKRVEFANWIDQNTDIIKSRLVFVDGSDKIFTWNGGVGVIDSVSGNDIILKDGKTFAQLGFDKGDTVAQKVLINGNEYIYTASDVDVATLTLDSTPTGVSAGDFVISKPVEFKSPANLEGFNKDHIYSYKNHLTIGNLDSVRLYFSDITKFDLDTGFDFVIPTGANRTLATPFFVNLDGNVTAIGEKRGILRVSTKDDWFKIKKANVVDSFDFYVYVEKSDTAERMGALPFAIAQFKGDLIYISQDKTIQNITDVDNYRESQIKIMSEEIEGLLKTLNLEDAKIDYDSQAISLIIPKEGMLLIFDTIEGAWQPPQMLPISCKSIIDGKQVGHSTSGNESYTLFEGGSDLGAEIEHKIALGQQSFNSKKGEYQYNVYERIGFNIRTTENAVIDTNIEFETGGANIVKPYQIEGKNLTFFGSESSIGLGLNPYGSVGIGDATKIDERLKRTIAFVNDDPISFFEWRPTFTLQGKDVIFQLLGISIDISTREARTIDEQLFLKPKES